MKERTSGEENEADANEISRARYILSVNGVGAEVIRGVSVILDSKIKRRETNRTSSVVRTRYILLLLRGAGSERLLRNIAPCALHVG